MIVRLPQRFYDDHVSRDLDGGTIVSETSRSYRVMLDLHAWDELLERRRALQRPEHELASWAASTAAL